jgi:hypothetical protein
VFDLLIFSVRKLMPPALSSGVLSSMSRPIAMDLVPVLMADVLDRLANDSKLLACLVKCWWARKPVHTAGSGAQQL